MYLKHRGRQAGGQALAEGAAFLLFLVPIVVASVLLNLLIVTFGYYKLVLTQIADAGARAAVDDMYWLGAPRPVDINGNSPQTNATNDAQNTCNSIAGSLGIPVTVQPDFSNPKSVGVTVSMASLPGVMNKLLPNTFKLQATAIEPYRNDYPIAMCTLGMFLQTNTAPSNSIQVQMPVYGVQAPGGGFMGTYGLPPAGTPSTLVYINDYAYTGYTQGTIGQTLY